MSTRLESVTCPLRFTIFSPLRKSTKFYKFLNLLLGAEHNSMMEGTVVWLRELTSLEVTFVNELLGFTSSQFGQCLYFINFLVVPGTMFPSIGYFCTTITTHLVAYWPCVDKSFIQKRVAEEKSKHGLVLVGVHWCFVTFLLLKSNSYQCENGASGLAYYLGHICAWVKNTITMSNVGIIITII